MTFLCHCLWKMITSGGTKMSHVVGFGHLSEFSHVVSSTDGDLKVCKWKSSMMIIIVDPTTQIRHFSDFPDVWLILLSFWCHYKWKMITQASGRTKLSYDKIRIVSWVSFHLSTPVLMVSRWLEWWLPKVTTLHRHGRLVSVMTFWWFVWNFSNVHEI